MVAAVDRHKPLNQAELLLADGERHCQRGTACTAPLLPTTTITHRESFILSSPRRTAPPASSTSLFLCARHTTSISLPPPSGSAAQHGKSTTHRYTLPLHRLHEQHLTQTHTLPPAAAVATSKVQQHFTLLRGPCVSSQLRPSGVVDSLLTCLPAPPSSPRWRYRLPQGRLCRPKLPRVPVPFHRGPAHLAYRGEGRRRRGRHCHQGHHVW